MAARPTAVTAVACLVIVFSATVMSMFLLRIFALRLYEITSISAVVWWFVCGLLPLYFLSGLFMLRGRPWARELCVATGASAVLFGFVVSPFTTVTAGQILFLVVTTGVLYTPSASAFFTRPAGSSRRVSLVSFLVGGFAIGLAATVSYVKQLQLPTSTSLDWLTRMGIARHSRTSEPSITELSVFAVNDENALVFLTGLAIVLAVVAMIMAVIAEYRNEPTLYLAGGYVCGALAVVVFKPVFGLAAMMAGIAAFLVVRHDRRVRDDT